MTENVQRIENVQCILQPRDVVSVGGSDCGSYLQSQVSQDIEYLNVDESAWSLALDPKGKVSAWFRITKQADRFLLDIDSGYGSTLLERLERFKLRVDVALELLEDWNMLTCFGAEAANAAVCEVDECEINAQIKSTVSWLDCDNVWVDYLGDCVNFPLNIRLMTAEEYQVKRIRSRWPAMGRELTEKTIPAEIAGLVEMSVSFTKGCYTGQELVARIDSRGGNVPRPLRFIEIDIGDAQQTVGDAQQGAHHPSHHSSYLQSCVGKVTAGDEVVVEDSVVGRITSAALDKRVFSVVALGVVHRSVAHGTVASVNGYRAQL